MASRLRSKLRAGRPLTGTVLTCREPLLAEVVGSRFDLAWIDLEHSPIDLDAVPALALALGAGGCAVLVRLPDPQFDRLTAVLDVGVDGVVVPHVDSAAAATDVVARVRYPPTGRRGYAARRAAAYGLRDDRRDEAPVCIAQIESRDAVASATAIGAVDGIDALVVGTADLALDLGVAPDVGEPALRHALTSVRDGARCAAVAFGVAAGGDPGAIVDASGHPPDIVMYSADVRIYAQAIDEAATRLAVAMREPSAVTPRSG